MKLLITGAGGLVGGSIAGFFAGQPDSDLLTPDRNELDVTDADSVSGYFRLHAPDAVIHAAAFTDNDRAEAERNNTRGDCYVTNVQGSRLIGDAAKQYGTFIICISTGSVFSGTPERPGPFTEEDIPGPAKNLSWYAACKLYGETAAGSGAAVIRLSHPAGLTAGRKTDYITGMLRLYDQGQLYPLFTDQYFPVSYSGDINEALRKLLQVRQPGIFHVVSETQTNPYALMTYVCNRTGRDPSNLKSITFDAFIADADTPARYSRYSAIDGTRTREILGLPGRPWQEIIDLTVSAL